MMQFQKGFYINGSKNSLLIIALKSVSGKIDSVKNETAELQKGLLSNRKSIQKIDISAK